MTSIRGTLARLFGGSAVDVEGVPEADLVVAPKTVDETARILDFASEHELSVLPWGRGRHQGFGSRVAPDVIVVTSGLDALHDWQPDDLTVVAGAGMSLGRLDSLLSERSQSAVLPETESEATLGGVVASGVSGYRRLRYGPTRERVLEITIVTGDGRVVRGGARVVKNVTGYDLPRLLTGSFGSLGIVVEVCFKLWPVPKSSATVTVGDPAAAMDAVFRPLAVLQTAEATTVHLSGTEAEVSAQAAALGGSTQDGLRWPDDPPGDCVVRVRVPPASTARIVLDLPGPFVASHGVGEIRAAVEPGQILDLRTHAERLGGSVAIEVAPGHVYDEIDPWGTPPATIELQRRIKAAFDPLGVMVPGRLPGGI